MTLQKKRSVFQRCLISGAMFLFAVTAVNPNASQSCRKTREFPKKSLEAKESCYLALLWRASWKQKMVGGAGGGFKYFCWFIVHPETWGRWTHFESYFSRGLQPPTSFFYEKLRVSFIVQFDAGNEGRFLRSIQSLKRVSVNFKFRKSNMKVYKYENTARWVDPIHRLYRLL